MAFENTFKEIDKTLFHDQGCSTAMDYVEQSSWVLFLKYFDDLEKRREQEAELEAKPYTRVISGDYRWNKWAMPRDANGEYDSKHALVGDDLITFVNEKLFPFLQGFKDEYAPDTIEYKVGVIYSNISNNIRSGYNLRDVIKRVDELEFQTAANRHEMTHLYEDRLGQMGNAGRNGGQYYTPRPLIRTIVKVVDPRIGETVYDGACGSAGFLCEAYSYMHGKPNLTSSEEEVLQKQTFFGKELKGLPYIIAIMNMILHGVQSPNIIHTNTLTESLDSITPSMQHDVILANPPFGGKEREEVQLNFPIRSSETAYMFMQHFMRILKPGGRAGIVIKNTFLSNGDASLLRKMLLEDCNVHTILDLPSGIFQAGVKTVVLFFTKGEPTRKIWYYQLDKHFTKTQPLTEADLSEFLAQQKTGAIGEKAWTLDVATLGEDYDLSVKNPNKVEVVDERTPAEIMDAIMALQNEADDIIHDKLMFDIWPEDDDNLFAEPVEEEDEA